MSVETVRMASESNPSTMVSAYMYMSYLWLGHCIHYPQDYREGALGFHDGDEIAADKDMDYFRGRLEQGPERILIDQLRSIIKSARKEAAIQMPLIETERSRLKIYLIGEVSVRGVDYSEKNGLFEDYPDLSEVRTPLADYHLVDGVMRYEQSGRISSQLRRYATMERLLPGYPQVTSEK